MSIISLSFLNGIIFTIYCFLVGVIILQKKDFNIRKMLLSLIPFLLCYYCILCLFDSIYSIFFSGILAFIFFKIVFNENNFMSLLLSLIIHSVKMAIKMIVLKIINDDSLVLLNNYKTLDWNAFYINLITLILAAIIIFLIRKILIEVIKNITMSKNREKFLLLFTYASFVIIIFFQPPDNMPSLQAITDMLIIFVVTGLGIFNVATEKKTEDLINHYQEIFEYSKANGELLTHYKMQVHESKNRLLMIKGMLDGPKKDTIKYIDGLLKEINNNRNNKYYWLAELKYIPFPGIRNFINYKLIKLRELGAEIEVFVSSDLEKIDVSSFGEAEYNQLSTILGVILDNMIESISKTNEKLVSINMYIEDGKIHNEYVNSYTGKIDISRLNEVGYTTKGEQHGVGLPLVDKIIKMNKRFDCNPEIIDNFFVQHLSIKLYEKDNLQKISKK